MFGNLYTWGNINIYYLSYLNNIKGRKYGIEELYFMVPIGLLFNNTVPLFGAWLNRFINIKIILFFSLSCIVGCHIMLLYLSDLFFIVIAMVIHGIGTGLMYYQAIRNCWGFFPKRKGLISGIYTCCFGVSSFFFTMFADYIINPDNKSPDENTKLYPIDVSKRVRKFIVIIVIIFLIFSSISVCLVFQFYEKVGSGKGKKKVRKEPLCQVLRNKKIYFICLLVFCVSFYGLTITYTSRGFGIDNKIDIKILKILSPTYAALNATGRIIWGLIYDKISFFYPYVIICILQMGCSASLYFSAKIGTAYLIVTLVSAIPFSGQATLFAPIVSHSYGMKNSGLLIGFVSCFISLSAIAGVTLCFYLNKYGGKYGYLELFLCGTGLTLVGFFFLFFINDKQFKYQIEDDEKDLISDTVFTDGYYNDILPEEITKDSESNI